MTAEDQARQLLAALPHRVEPGRVSVFRSDGGADVLPLLEQALTDAFTDCRRGALEEAAQLLEAKGLWQPAAEVRGLTEEPRLRVGDIDRLW